MDTWLPPDDDFPCLTADRYTKTSEPDARYNCVAWVLSRTDKWIDPAGADYGYAWPIDCTDTTIDNFVALYRHFGFEVTGDCRLESGKEKIVLFSKDGGFTHVAKLIRDGIWSSKMGEEMDCEHELRAVEGRLYGSPDVYMVRNTRERSGMFLT